MSGRLIVVAGLPGSGKSTFFESLAGDEDVVTIDDYRGHQYGENSDPRLNKYYGQMLHHLEEGKTVYVSDILYVVAKYRHELLAAILGVLPETLVDYMFFETDIEICKKRVSSRGRPDEAITRELELIDKLSQQASQPHIEIREARP